MLQAQIESRTNFHYFVQKLIFEFLKIQSVTAKKNSNNRDFSFNINLLNLMSTQFNKPSQCFFFKILATLPDVIILDYKQLHIIASLLQSPTQVFQNISATLLFPMRKQFQSKCNEQLTFDEQPNVSTTCPCLSYTFTKTNTQFVVSVGWKTWLWCQNYRL